MAHNQADTPGTPNTSSFTGKELRQYGLLFLVVLFSSLLGIASRPLGQFAMLWPTNALLLGLFLRSPALVSPTGWWRRIFGFDFWVWPGPARRHHRENSSCKQRRNVLIQSFRHADDYLEYRRNIQVSGTGQPRRNPLQGRPGALYRQEQRAQSNPVFVNRRIMPEQASAIEAIHACCYGCYKKYAATMYDASLALVEKQHEFRIPGQ